MTFLTVHGVTYPVKQINGQRIVGPPVRYTNTLPPDTFEIYVTRLPTDLFEDQLMLIFGRYGLIYHFRLMMTFSGSNRSFAYIQYASQRDAQYALHMLNHVPFSPSRFLYAAVSRNKRELVFCNLDESLSKYDVCAKIMELAKPLTVKFFTLKNIMHAIVVYNTHRETAIGRRHLMQEIRYFGENCCLKWHYGQFNETKQCIHNF